jgi:hypothetical protein
MNQYLISVQYLKNGGKLDALLSISAVSEEAALSAAASYSSVIKVYGVVNHE